MSEVASLQPGIPRARGDSSPEDHMTSHVITTKTTTRSEFMGREEEEEREEEKPGERAGKEKERCEKEERVSLD